MSQQPRSGAPADRPALNWPVKALYATGSIGNGIKKGGLAGFLLIYYNQVAGLPSAMVGLVLSLALLVDAIVDPLVGQASDNLTSRWGRRHPFMYASIVPVSLAFALLWMAPQSWSPPQLLTYLLALVLLVRVFDTFFEIPAAALLAEMTDDYDQRTAVISLRYIFGAVGALTMKFIAYRIFLTPTADDPSGVLNRSGFQAYGLASGVIIFATILAACLGTHRFIPFLHRPRRRAVTLVAMLKEAAATLGDRSWAALAAGGALMAIAKGAASGLGVYLMIYFWGLRGEQIAFLVGSDMIASITGAFAAAPIARRFGKRRAAILALLAAYGLFAGPVALKLFGLMPAAGSQELVASLFAINLVQEFAGMIAAILISSMMVDLVEHTQLRTGRRSEGLLLAADNLLQKAVAGAGVFISGIVLALVHFPAKARPGRVPQETVDALATVLISGMTPLYLAAAGLLLFYRIDRRAHERNLVELRRRGGSQSPDAPTLNAAAPLKATPETGNG